MVTSLEDAGGCCAFYDVRVYSITICIYPKSSDLRLLVQSFKFKKLHYKAFHSICQEHWITNCMIILFEVEVQNNFVFNAKIAKNRKNQAAAADC